MRSRCVVFNVVFCAFLCVFSAWCFCVPFRVFSFFNSTTMLLHVIQTIFTIAGMGSTKDETTTTLLTAHCSLLTVSRLPHHSPHTIHHSPLTTHHSPLTTHHYVHHSPLTTLTTHCPLTRSLKCTRCDQRVVVPLYTLKHMWQVSRRCCRGFQRFT